MIYWVQPGTLSLLPLPSDRDSQKHKQFASNFSVLQAMVLKRMLLGWDNPWLIKKGKKLRTWPENILGQFANTPLTAAGWGTGPAHPAHSPETSSHTGALQPGSTKQICAGTAPSGGPSPDQTPQTTASLSKRQQQVIPTGWDGRFPFSWHFGYGRTRYQQEETFLEVSQHCQVPQRISPDSASL